MLRWMCSVGRLAAIRVSVSAGQRWVGQSAVLSQAPSKIPPALWKLGRLNHVAIATPDLEKSTALYRYPHTLLFHFFFNPQFLSSFPSVILPKVISDMSIHTHTSYMTIILY